jgi:radical SAM superfamily enzyme YgiQ (UPF0313 family)
MPPTRKLLIYLADLTHTGQGKLATEAFPLNIGLIKSAALKRFGDQVDIRLFKYPERLEAALVAARPDIIGFSNYVWNSNLSYAFLRHAKKQNPNVVTVFGGTNYPFSSPEQEKFLQKRPQLDFAVFYEGERSFGNIVQRWLDCVNLEELFAVPIPGCQFLDKTSGKLISGEAVARLKNFDEVPSPYTSGILDEFFDGKLTPFMETNRGCPFACNFCNAGDSYYNKINDFSLDRVREELNYIARKIGEKNLGITHLTLADNNFGMFERDLQVVQMVDEVQKENISNCGWPLRMTVWTGKNSKERVIRTTEILGDKLNISMSVQSLNEQVLKNIRRSNIKLEHIYAINKHLSESGRPQYAETILPLPGETRESYLKGLRDLVNAGVWTVGGHTLTLLHGTEYMLPEYREQHGIQSRWRLVVLDFGEYLGEKVFDAEECCIATSTMSFEDYLYCRKVLLALQLFYNGHVYTELMKFFRYLKLNVFDIVTGIISNIASAPPSVQLVFDSFDRDTNGELFATEADLVDFYSMPDNYRELIKGEIGANVMFKHFGIMYTKHLDDWFDYIHAEAWRLIEPGAAKMGSDTYAQLVEIMRYIRLKASGAIQPTANTDPVVVNFKYDIKNWSESKDAIDLSDCFSTSGFELQFHFEETQIAERRDAAIRYGTDLSGIAKAMQRLGSPSSLFRKVRFSKTKDQTRETSVANG